ncbi:MAG: hypothetical protein HYV33_06040 [Candidatus Kerfeldbacteria bacterium]|nr:hypothetical protein [Candidatus Kerfeldbacteria bacterium]
MRLTSQQLDHLPVYTAAQTFLGYVIGFELDVEQQTIITYYVSRRRWFNAADFLISAQQVLTMTEDKMTVVDTIVPATSPVPLLNQIG